MSLLAAIALACSGPGFDPPAAAGTVNAETGGMLSTGGRPTGGAVGSGGLVGTGGATATGGALPDSGGVASSGGVPATGGDAHNETGGVFTPGPPSGCRTNADCEGKEPRCLRPGERWTPPPNCGAIDWCGECQCPPMPELLLWIGAACTGDADCQAHSTDLHCSAEGQCELCREDLDCPAATPRCSAPIVLNPWGAIPRPLRRCVECVAHDDCGGLTPACDSFPSGDGQSWGRCVECAADVPCGVGVCQQGMCVPECSEDLQCGSDGLRGCSNLNRCEPTPCATDMECGALGVCSDGACERRGCSDDSACGEGNACVQGECFAAGGSCVDTFQLPVP